MFLIEVEPSGTSDFDMISSNVAPNESFTFLLNHRLVVESREGFGFNPLNPLVVSNKG